MRTALTRVWHRLHTPHLSARVIAASVGVGLAIGLLPTYGIHSVLVLAVCVPLRLDSVLAFAATMISNPLTFPLLVLAELKVGEWLLGKSSVSLEELRAGSGWALAGQQLMLGTIVLAVLVGIVGSSLAWALARHWQRRQASAGSDP